MYSFPSFEKITAETRITFLRFPLEIIVAVVGTVCAVYSIDENDKELQRMTVKIIMACSLCLVLFLSISLYFLRDLKNNLIRFGSSLIIGSLMFIFIFQFSDPIKSFEIYQFLALNLALHLLVSFSAFITKKYDENAFWEFNKQLFLRILTSGLYSVFIYAGLSFALLATHHLFNVDFYDTIYLDLFYIVFGVFNTVFFLAGVPETNNTNFPLNLRYPNGLKKFTQFVLIPLISIYLLILLSYEVKIIAMFSLPIGWVSNLILVFAIFGILSLLLIHPIADEKGNVWMRTFHRWFYFLLLPLLVLLFWAILYRINLYGVTHERYYVLALSIWLTVLTVYFIFVKKSKIKFIPVSMCVIALLTILGPQSADSISKKSQLSRFENYARTNKKTKLTIEQEKDLSSIVTFINDNYGVKELAAYSKKLVPLSKKENKPSNSQIMEALGYTFRGNYYNTNDSNESFYYNYYNVDEMKVALIQGYDFEFEIIFDYISKCNDCIKLNGKTYSVNYTKTNYGVELKVNEDVIPLRINDFILKNKTSFDSNTKKITQTINTPKYKILLDYQSLNGEKGENEIKLNWFNIKVLLKIK